MTKADLQQKFNTEMNNRCPDSTGHHFVVALSGGCDSTALAFLLRDWLSDKTDHRLTCAIIDHQIRPESSAEAAEVAAYFTQMGFDDVEIIKWQRDDVSESVSQSDARQGRYHLLHQICENRGAEYLLMGHHLDDQIETFLYRLSKASGLRGLCGIAPERRQNGVTYLRPLLNIRKSSLIEYCVDHQLKWVEDPSNKNDKYTRTAMRSLCVSMEKSGIDMAHIHTSIAKVNTAQNYINDQFLMFCDTEIRISTHGYAIMHFDTYLELHSFMQSYVMTELLSLVSNAPYPPRAISINNILAKLSDGTQKIMTLHGCVLDLKIDSEMLYIYREERALPEVQTLATGQRILWDEKYDVIWHGTGTITLRPFLDAGQTADVKENAEIMNVMQAYPHALRRVALSIWQDDKLVAIPMIGYQSCGDALEINNVFAQDRQIKIV